MPRVDSIGPPKMPQSRVPHVTDNTDGASLLPYSGAECFALKKGSTAMTGISRRHALTKLLAATTVSAASLLAFGVAQADTPGSTTPEKTPGTRGTGLKAQLTPGDREMNRKCINKTLNEAPTGKTWSWKNPKTGNGGTVTPTTPRKREGAEVCRDFNETVTLKDGRSEQINGHACKKPDGSWSIA
jgi:surface antigen